MNAATQVFGISELCGIIYEYLDNADIFRLQDLSMGSRRYLREYKPWQSSIFHQTAYTGHTVKPTLPVPRNDDDDDPKRVTWIYTSGPSTGAKVAKRMMRPVSPPPTSSQMYVHASVPGFAGPSTQPSAQSMVQATTQSATQTPAQPPTQPPAASPAFFGGLVRRRRSPAYSSHRTQMQAVTLNWLLEAKFPKWKYYPISNMLGLEEEVPMGAFFTNPDASYRPLLLMTPPLSEVTVMDWRSRIFEVTNAKGVTMGDVVDALLGEQI